MQWLLLSRRSRRRRQEFYILGSSTVGIVRLPQDLLFLSSSKHLGGHYETETIFSANGGFSGLNFELMIELEMMLRITMVVLMGTSTYTNLEQVCCPVELFTQTGRLLCVTWACIPEEGVPVQSFILVLQGLNEPYLNLQLLYRVSKQPNC